MTDGDKRDQMDALLDEVEIDLRQAYRLALELKLVDPHRDNGFKRTLVQLHRLLGEIQSTSTPEGFIDGDGN